MILYLKAPNGNLSTKENRNSLIACKTLMNKPQSCDWSCHGTTIVNCPLSHSYYLFTVSRTAYYALGLIASTQGGVHRLAELGWRSVMNHRSEEWPVVSDQMVFSDPDAVREIRSLSDGSSVSHSSGR